MKTYNISKIGTAALAAVLVLGIEACAHHRGRTAALATVRTPQVQTTLLAAPSSLEGAWIKVQSHSAGEPAGAQTDWWYIKNGKSHFYFSEECSEGHPATPGSLGSPQTCEDSLGRNYNIGTISYHPQGKTATLRIENADRHDTTLCRSVQIEDDFITGVSEAPAVITFKSAGSGVYRGTIEGVISPYSMPSNSVQMLDTITIYTR